VAVDAQRERGVGVSELIHHAPRIDAKRDEDRGEGVSELVRCPPVGQRRFVGLGQGLVGTGDRLVEPTDTTRSSPCSAVRLHLLTYASSKALPLRR
jgi:hypothetical protein